MYLMLGDEADHEQNGRNKFFVYGGLFVNVAQVQALHAEVKAIRMDTGFQPTDPLKFSSKTCPKHITKEKHTEAKRRAITAAQKCGAKFSVQVTLHELARSTDHDDLVKWGANTILGRFNDFLENDANDFGLALLDRLPVKYPYRYLQEKFQTGLEFPWRDPVRLERILGLASTCDGASHVASVADIVLGAFRYCANEPERDKAGSAMFPSVARLMWHSREGNRIKVRGRGLVLSPKTVREPRLQNEYDDLIGRLSNYLQPKSDIAEA
ncbi:MAG: hypothetical protein MI824_01985 [Hyphomicrobiales bacterium]|nr:hypothetical protein [Hyphomicrobiales bacterium]